MAYWLFKSEPTAYSFDDLLPRPIKRPAGTACGTFRRRNFLRDSIKVGDGVLFYHSGADPPCIAGIAEVVKPGHPDPTAFDPKDQHFDPKSDRSDPTWFQVSIKAVRPIDPPAFPTVLEHDSRVVGHGITPQGEPALRAAGDGEGVEDDPFAREGEEAMTWFVVRFADCTGRCVRSEVGRNKKPHPCIRVRVLQEQFHLASLAFPGHHTGHTLVCRPRKGLRSCRRDPLRLFFAFFLTLASGFAADASDKDREIKIEPYVTSRKVTRPRDLTKEFMQRAPDFALEDGGRRVTPTMTGFIYHGQRLEGNQLLLEQRRRGIRGWAPVSAVVPLTEAEGFFSQEILRDPNRSFAFLMRGLARFEKDDREHALADLDEALRLEPKNIAALTTRAFLGLVMRAPDQAIADANRAVAIDPRNCYVLEQRAMIQSSLNNDDEALRDFDRAIELGSRWVMTYVGRGMIYLKRRELQKAQVEIQHALQIDPSCVQAYVHLAVIHLMLSDPNRALVAANKAIELDPESDGPYAAKAVIDQSIGNLSQALKDLDQAIRNDPADATHVLNRASVKFDNGDYEPALGDADMAIRLEPTNAEAHHIRAQILAACPAAKYRNGQQAVTSATRACELANFKNSRYLATLAMACSETSDFAAAVKWQERAIDILAADDPNRREYDKLLKRYQAGKPYHRLGLLEALGLKAPAVAAKSASRNVD